MAASKCPLCDSPCIIKIIATGDDRLKEVDVCKMCGAMYPRESALRARHHAVKKPVRKKARAKAKPKAKKPGKARKGKKKPQVKKTSGKRKR